MSDVSRLPSFTWSAPATYEPMVVWEPKTWLLREGWLMYGRIDFREVPSSNATRSKQPPARARANARGQAAASTRDVRNADRTSGRRY